MFLVEGKERNKMENKNVMGTSLPQLQLRNKTLSNKASDYRVFDLLKMMRDNNSNRERSTTQQIETNPGEKICSAWLTKH